MGEMRGKDSAEEVPSEVLEVVPPALSSCPSSTGQLVPTSSF